MNSSTTATGYEFTSAENEVIGKTASAAKTWGITSIVIGAFTLLQMLLAIESATVIMTAVTLVQGVVAIIVGAFFVMTAGALSAVVDTAGDDVAHMMIALKKMAAAFTAQLVAVGLGFIIGAVGGAMGASL